MNSGIDFDGVLFDSEFLFKTMSVIFDMETNGKGVQSPEELRACQRYNWSKEKDQEFLDKYLVQVEKSAPVMPYAKEILKKLKHEGHKLYGITTRGYTCKDEVQLTLKRLKKEKIKFDDIRFGITDKAKSCKELNIDIMIEDYYKNVEDISQAGIKCLYFRDLVLKFCNLDNVIEVNNWGEIYIEIQKFNKNIEN